MLVFISISFRSSNRNAKVHEFESTAGISGPTIGMSEDEGVNMTFYFSIARASMATHWQPMTLLLYCYWYCYWLLETSIFVALEDGDDNGNGNGNGSSEHGVRPDQPQIENRKSTCNSNQVLSIIPSCTRCSPSCIAQVKHSLPTKFRCLSPSPC